MRAHLVAKVVAGALTAALAAAGCSTSATHPSSAASSTSVPGGASPLPAPGGSTSAATTSPSAPSATTAPGAHNLAVTDDTRAQLVAAGAAEHGLAPSDYAGLRPGQTYYAVDSNGVYWAGASLDPSPSSTPAQVSSQDDGAYLLFERPVGSAWKVFNVGLAGFGGTPCPIAVPADVLALWGWGVGTCRPAVLN